MELSETPISAQTQSKPRPRWVTALVILALLGGLVGWAVMEYAAPPLITSASQGDSSIGALNNYFQPRGQAGVATWMNRTNKLGNTLLVAGIVFSLVTLAVTGRRFEKLAGTATPGEVGATRFLVCGILLWSAIWEDLASTSLLPREFIRSMGTMNFVRKVPGFDPFLASHTALAAFEWVTCILLLLGMIGLFSRITVPLAAACYFIFAGIMRQYTWFWHVGLIPVFVLFALSLMPSGDGFSIDRLRRMTRDKPVPPRDLATPFYGWCIYICWLPVCLAYLWAGLSKIAYGGWDWWRADNLRGIVVQDSLQPMEFDTRIGQHLAQAPGILFAAMGIGAILTELSGILPVLLPRDSRAGKLIRWIVPLSLAGTHVGIWVMQNILFFDLILIQAMFIDWRGVRRWIGSKLSPGALVEYPAIRRWFFLSLPVGEGRGEGAFDVQKSYGSGTHLHTDPLSAGEGTRYAPPGAWIKVALCLFVTFWTAVWFNRIEFYPLTSVQMYTRRDRELGVIYYTRVLAHYEDGRIGRAHLDKGIGALADGRYRRVIDFALSKSPKDQALADRVLRTCGREMNRDARGPSERIKQFEVQRVVWHYKRDADDPEKGKVTQVYFTSIAS